MLIEASACGKVILCGEHAVVYQQPGLALPLSKLRAVCQLRALVTGPACLKAPDLGLTLELPAEREPLPSDSREHPLVITLYEALRSLQQTLPAVEIQIHSQIPIKRGLGSGSAISAAVLRAFAAWFGLSLTPQATYDFVQQIEALYHGQPSGIDATVVAYEQPLRFVRGQAPQLLALSTDVPLLLVDSGQAAPTHEVVGWVREQVQAQPEAYAEMMQAIGALCPQVEQALATQNWPQLGALLNHNQQLLQQLGVSNARLDQLVSTALQAGAWGAKLSGGGWGGICLALAAEPEPVIQAWQQLGFEQIYQLSSK